MTDIILLVEFALAFIAFCAAIMYRWQRNQAVRQAREYRRLLEWQATHSVEIGDKQSSG